LATRVDDDHFEEGHMLSKSEDSSLSGIKTEEGILAVTEVGGVKFPIP
jgi:hypothetical protein